MISFPPCKINLGLYVTGKRSDGFHTIESIFLPVSLKDALEVIVTEENVLKFDTTGIAIEGLSENNICVKAYRLLQAEFGLPGIQSYLLKNIPTGAGLGGGSSDAASMLLVLNEIFSLRLSADMLKKYAAQLGSDCPFFIENKPCYVTGRGEVMEPIALDLTQLFICIIHPKVHVSTAEAYQLISPREADFDLGQILDLPLSEWKNTIINHFEEPIAKLHPAIEEIKNELYRRGALYASMSGSGSAIYGIFNEAVNLKETFKEYFYWSGKFL